MKIYVIKLGGNLYVESKFYGLFPSTTSNIIHAQWFENIEDVQRKAKGMFGATVEEYYLLNSKETNSEIDTLRLALEEAKRQRDEAIENNKKLKGEN